VRHPHRPLALIWLAGAVPGPEEGCGGPGQKEKEGGSAVKGSLPLRTTERSIFAAI